MYRKSSPSVGVGIVIIVSKMLKFYVKHFFVIGKALSGEISFIQTGLVVCTYQYPYTHTNIHIHNTFSLQNITKNWE